MLDAFLSENILLYTVHSARSKLHLQYVGDVTMFDEFHLR